jgi:hypothetical protein
MAVYACDLGVVRGYIGSRDRALVAAAVATEAGSALEDGHRQALQALVDGTFPTDEDEYLDTYGGIMNFALEALCDHASVATAPGLEMYDDRQASPVLYRFLWDPWDGADTLGLTVVDDDLNAVTWRGPGLRDQYLAEFRAVQAAGGYPRCLSEETAGDIVEVLEHAREAGVGVFVFTKY